MRPRSRLFALLAGCVLLEVPAVAYGLSVHRADGLKTISWDG